MRTFAKGQYVELYPTIPSSTNGGSIVSGTRGIVLEAEPVGDEALYLVAFLAGQERIGEQEWVTGDDLFAA